MCQYIRLRLRQNISDSTDGLQKLLLTCIYWDNSTDFPDKRTVDHFNLVSASNCDPDVWCWIFHWQKVCSLDRPIWKKVTVARRTGNWFQHKSCAHLTVQIKHPLEETHSMLFMSTLTWPRGTQRNDWLKRRIIVFTTFNVMQCWASVLCIRFTSVALMMK